MRWWLCAEANGELVGRKGKQNHQIQIMASEASARGGQGRAWHCFSVYKYCLLFSGLQGEAEWSICATQPCFVLCAPNDCQLGGRKPIRDDRQQEWLLLAPRIALSLGFAFQSVRGAKLSAGGRGCIEAGDKDLVCLVYLDSYSQVVYSRLCFHTWKVGIHSNSTFSPWLYGVSKIPDVTVGPNGRPRPVKFPREKAGWRAIV